MAKSDGPVWSSVLTGVFIGTLVGGAVALLFAPKSGMALRDDLEIAVDDLKDKAEQALDDLQEQTAVLMERSKNALAETRENIARSVEAGKDAYASRKAELTAELEGEA